MQERENRERRWLRLHAITAPMGVAAVTALLAWLGQSTGENQSATASFLDSAADRAYLATVTYALIAAIGEGVVRMVFWAWSEHKKAIQGFKDAGRAEGRAEGREEGRAEGRTEGRAEGRTEGRAEGRAEAAKEYESKLAELAKERDAGLDAAGNERQAQLIEDVVARALDARLGAAREWEDSLAAAWERAKADGIDLDKYLKP